MEVARLGNLYSSLPANHMVQGFETSVDTYLLWMCTSLQEGQMASVAWAVVVCVSFDPDVLHLGTYLEEVSISWKTPRV